MGGWVCAVSAPWSGGREHASFHSECIANMSHDGRRRRRQGGKADGPTALHSASLLRVGPTSIYRVGESTIPDLDREITDPGS